MVGRASQSFRTPNGGTGPTGDGKVGGVGAAISVVFEPMSSSTVSTDRTALVDEHLQDPGRRVDWARMRTPRAAAALGAAAVAAIGTTAGTVVAGQLVEHRTSWLLLLLALCVVGGSLIESVGKFVWVGLCDR